MSKASAPKKQRSGASSPSTSFAIAGPAR